MQAVCSSQTTNRLVFWSAQEQQQPYQEHWMKNRAMKQKLMVPVNANTAKAL
jgi:hypothetical protein